MPRSYLEVPTLRIGTIDDAGAKRYPGMTATITGSPVFELQVDLHSLGFLLPQADGAFGQNTERAVRAFQRAASLTDDGVAGPDTKKALATRAAAAATAGNVQNLARSYPYLKKAIEAQGFAFETKPLWLNLVGLRGFWHGQKVANDFNLYNDTIYAAWVDAGGKPHVEAFDASCDPGRLDPSLQNKGGVAHLMEGQWHFQQGLHRGDYRALCQARAVRVKRFFDDDPERVRPWMDEGFFGINIHAAGKTGLVNNWSAGCQVIHGGREGEAWKRFDKLVYETGSTGQALLPYSLLRSDALPDGA